MHTETDRYAVRNMIHTHADWSIDWHKQTNLSYRHRSVNIYSVQIVRTSDGICRV